jgi:putative oxidoreductase
MCEPGRLPSAGLVRGCLCASSSATGHLPNGFSSIKPLAVTPAGARFGQPGYETDLLYFACLAALVLGGSGPFALDSIPPRRLPPNESE